MEPGQGQKRSDGGAGASSGGGKCKACREKRRLRCFTAPGASKCKRCTDLGILCVSPLTASALEGPGACLSLGECGRELARPSTMYRTRQAISHLLELFNERLSQGNLPIQVVANVRFILHRARASNDTALLHAAVSLCASLRIEDSISLLDPEHDDEMDPERVEALVAEADEFVLRRRELDGLGPECLASVRKVVRKGVSEVTCNELFRRTFFDVADKGIRGLYYDLSVALVDEESAEALKALDESVVEEALFGEASRTPGDMIIATTTSDAPLVLVGGAGERLRAKIRLESSWSIDGSITVTHMALIGLRPNALGLAGVEVDSLSSEQAASDESQPSTPTTSTLQTPDPDDCLYDDPDWFLVSLFDAEEELCHLQRPRES